jgi:hypothetical protein
MVDIFGLNTTAVAVRGLEEEDDLSLAFTESPEGNFVVRSCIMTLNIMSFELVSNVTNLYLGGNYETKDWGVSEGILTFVRHNSK